MSSVDGRVRDISNSPAYTFLDSLLKQGKLSPSEVELFKTKYQKLHEIVIQTYSNEKILLEKAKELKNTLEAERIKLEQRTILAHDTSADIEILTKEEKEWNNKITEAIEEKNSLQFEFEELQNSKNEQKNTLEEKYKKSLQLLDPLITNLNTKLEELKSEIEKQQEIYSKESASVNDYLEKIENAGKNLVLFEKEKIKKRSQYQAAQGEPERIRANISMLESVIKELETENGKLLEEMKNKEGILSSLYQEKRVAQGEIEELGVKLENFRLAIAKRKTNIDDLKRAREMEENKKENLLEKLSAIEIEKKSQREEMKNSMQSMNEYHKLIENQKKMYEKLKRKRDTILSIHKPLLEQIAVGHRQYEEMNFQFKQQKTMLNEIKSDEELFISQYLAQEKLEEDTTDLLYSVQADKKEYEEKIKVLDKEEKSLQSLVHSLSAQRELLAREASKSGANYRETKEDLKVKNLIFHDLEKQSLEMKERVKFCKKRFEKIKNQRNKLANLTQSSSQALSEMKEKIKILHNEVEILKNESFSKEKALAEEVRLHESGMNTRDQLRIEQNKYEYELKNKKEEEMIQMMEMIKLNSLINNAELQMISLKRDYAAAVDARNLTGIQLIDRNDELCILYEKSNIQQEILKRGEEEIQHRQEELTKICHEIDELKRRMELARKKIPSLQVYMQKKKELEDAEKIVAKEREKTKQLSDELESPQTTVNKEEKDENTANASTDGTSSSGTVVVRSSIRSSSSFIDDSSAAGRWRRLKGTDPESEQLAAKIEVLEERLNDKKEALLEKELVLDEVTALSDKLRMQAAEGRGLTLQTAKRVNDYQAKIRKTTRKMMAAVSELSLYQATAMKLEAEKNENERRLSEAKHRYHQALPPTDDAEHEWIRIERDRQRKQEALLHQRKAKFDQTSTKTTAEARPNAYIPDELALPKPYGHLAPFKPSTQGATMRHFKTPQPQPVIL